MRPYLILCLVVLMAVAAFGQTEHPGVYGRCLQGCGPFIPLITTPSISLEQVSPNPVGASNATTGLVAGATNATLSQISGNTSSTYTQPVWYDGGSAPLISPNVHLWPQPVGRPMHAMNEEHGDRGTREEAHAEWVYFGGAASTSSPVRAAQGGKKANRTYTNDDVTRQNDGNGNVKMKGKSEKL